MATPTARRPPAANTDDPRYRRARARICEAVRELLKSTDPDRLTFAQVAAASGINRSTVHQHYSSRHELIADALAGELDAIAEPLRHCPFDSGADTPPEVVAMAKAAVDQRRVLTKLGDTDRCLVAARLADRLAERLRERFSSGRPPGFDRVDPAVHADYVAGGLARLLVFGDQQAVQLAEQAWRLVAPTHA